jgi:hypothetical protein
MTNLTAHRIKDTKHQFKYIHKDHGSLFIHESKTNSKYKYLYSSKEKFISNLFPTDIDDLYLIPNYQDKTFHVRVTDSSLEVIEV